jgi:hypothetical protein
MLERLARDKCSSLLGLFISNEHFFGKIATIGQCDQTVLFIDDAPVKEGFTLASL